MHPQRRRYRAYLLRLWPMGSGLAGDALWRASLESTLTGEKWAFVGLDALFAFLREQTATARPLARE